jgi:3-oxoacyl-[acyl-carrier protein] reductase
MDLQLDGKVALVTASSKGLGRAAALALAQEGARVAICARSDVLDEAEQEIRATGAEVLAVRADVTEQADIDRVVAAALDRFKQIDVLVSNVAGPPPGTFLTLKPADWEAGVQLTLMSAVRLFYAVVPHMLERGSGSIVASQSFTVKQPADNLILSNAIRLAVIGLVRSMANELGPKGIRVNSINPGWVMTGRVDQLMADRAKNNNTTAEQEIAKTTAAIPVRRMADPGDYGRAVAWLASPVAWYVQGQALIFDGGLVQSPL